MARTFL